MNQLLESALALATAGYPVLPCVPGEKNPITANGVKDATTDAAIIKSWWQRWPTANVAVATDGLLVLDVDTLEGGAPNPWQPPDLATCPVSLTPRGGKHYVFRQPEGKALRNTAGKIAPHVDTRADGGYILVAPSVVNGKPYAWSAESLQVTRRENLPEPPAWLLSAVEAAASTKREPSQSAPLDATKPGDDFCTRATWQEILAPHGWRFAGEALGAQRWTRPGKDFGVSATTGYCKSETGRDLLYVFTPNAPPLEAGQSYSKFAAIAVLEHAGDYGAAASALAARGFGVRDESRGDAERPRGPAPKPFSINVISSAELDSGDFTTNYLVEGVLAERQPMVIAAPMKTMKTTIAAAMAVALGLGKPFLGSFAVPRACNTLIISGESGMPALQSAGRRIAESYGYSLGDIGRLHWSADLPRLGNDEHLDVLRGKLIDYETEVLICDPLYFMLPGQDAGNMMIVGGYLRTLSALCDEMGVTLVVVHHCKRTTKDQRYAMPELADISWAGTAEWARQWVLLNRRKPYDPGTGEHALWMVLGGSAGHSGYWALDAFEGIGHNRTWHVALRTADDVREDHAASAERAKADKQAEKQKTKLERNKRSIVDALLKMPEHTGTKSEIKAFTGLSSAAVNVALAELLDSEDIVLVKISKGNNREYDAFSIAA